MHSLSLVAGFGMGRKGSLNRLRLKHRLMLAGGDSGGFYKGSPWSMSDGTRNMLEKAAADGHPISGKVLGFGCGGPGESLTLELEGAEYSYLISDNERGTWIDSLDYWDPVSAIVTKIGEGEFNVELIEPGKQPVTEPAIKLTPTQEKLASKLKELMEKDRPDTLSAASALDNFVVEGPSGFAAALSVLSVDHQRRVIITHSMMTARAAFGWQLAELLGVDPIPDDMQPPAGVDRKTYYAAAANMVGYNHRSALEKLRKYWPLEKQKEIMKGLPEAHRVRLREAAREAGYREYEAEPVRERPQTVRRPSPTPPPPKASTPGAPKTFKLLEKLRGKGVKITTEMIVTLACLKKEAAALESRETAERMSEFITKKEEPKRGPVADRLFEQMFDEVFPEGSVTWKNELRHLAQQVRAAVEDREIQSAINTKDCYRMFRSPHLSSLEVLVPFIVSQKVENRRMITLHVLEGNSVVLKQAVLDAVLEYGMATLLGKPKGSYSSKYEVEKWLSRYLEAMFEHLIKEGKEEWAIKPIMKDLIDTGLDFGFLTKPYGLEDENWRMLHYIYSDMTRPAYEEKKDFDMGLSDRAKDAWEYALPILRSKSLEIPQEMLKVFRNPDKKLAEGIESMILSAYAHGVGEEFRNKLIAAAGEMMSSFSKNNDVDSAIEVFINSVSWQ